MPCLNQKAREVPPFRSSLSSSGIYLLVSKVRLIFWIGHDFYDCYLDQNTYNKQSELIHEELMNKILYIYEQATTAGLEEITEAILSKTVKKKVYYSVEGTDVSFDEYIDGTKVRMDKRDLSETKRNYKILKDDDEEN